MNRWTALPAIKRAYRPGFGLLLCASAALLVLELVLPIVTMQIYDRVLPNTSTATLALLLGLAFAALVLEIGIRLARSRLVAFSGFSMTHQLSQSLMQKVLTCRDMRFASVGDRMQTFSQLGALRDFHSGYATVTVLELALIPVFIGAIALIAGWVALVPLVLLFIFAVCLRRRSGALHRAIERRDKSDTARYDYIIEMLTEISSVKALALEPHLARHYEHLKSRSASDGYQASLRLLALFDVSALFASLITIGTIIAGALVALYGQVTAGGLIACILLSGRVMQPVRRALSLYAQKTDFDMASAQIDALIAEAEKTVALPNPETFENDGHLQIKHMSLGRDKDNPFLTISALDIQPGSFVLIDGPESSGKSALLSALAGDLTPTEGEATLGGANIFALSAAQKNAAIGYLPKEGQIYRGSILDNVTRFGETPFVDAMYLVQLLAFDADIAKLPAGIETRLEGTGADPIPPGLKQRVAFARGLANRPRLILFDSADAGLDRASYDALYRLFSKLKGKATIILATDDEHLRDLATRHFEIQNGELIEHTVAARREISVRGYTEIRA